MKWPEEDKKLLKAEIMPLSAEAPNPTSDMPSTIGQRPTLLWWSAAEK
jgi:hypothetical protein